jgi:hypothetical protein
MKRTRLYLQYRSSFQRTYFHVWFFRSHLERTQCSEKVTWWSGVWDFFTNVWNVGEIVMTWSFTKVFSMYSFSHCVKTVPNMHVLFLLNQYTLKISSLFQPNHFEISQPSFVLSFVRISLGVAICPLSAIFSCDGLRRIGAFCNYRLHYSVA